MAILDQTSGVAYATLSDAIRYSDAGDVIAVSAGLYTEDLATVYHSLTIEGVGGMVQLQAPGGMPDNGKAILVDDAPTLTLDHLEFSGASDADGNGAGIRFESGGTLTVSNCWLHDNQDGLLAGAIRRRHARRHRFRVQQQRRRIRLHPQHLCRRHRRIRRHRQLFPRRPRRPRDQEPRRGQQYHRQPHRGRGRPPTPAIRSTCRTAATDTVNGNTVEKGADAQNWTFLHFGGEQFPTAADASLQVEGNVFVADETGGPPNLVRNQTSGPAGLAAPVTIARQHPLRHRPRPVVQRRRGRRRQHLRPAAGTSRSTPSHPFSMNCFAEGTRIATPTGERPIETLRAGDRVRTHSGDSVPILWIGGRDCDAAAVAAHRQLRPVRIAPHALAPGVPARPLWVSPEHALLVAGVLVPAAALVNGVSITRGASAAIGYLHLQLDQHDLLVAEGCPAESFLRDAAHPMPLPRLQSGARLDRIWHEIALRAGVPPRRPAGPLRGHVERIESGAEGWTVEGWATTGGAPLVLDVVMDGAPPRAVLANRYRADLDHAGVGEGCCGFRLALPPGVRNIRVLHAGAAMPVTDLPC